MTQSEIGFVKSLIVRTKTQNQEVYLFLRNLINNQDLELTIEQRFELDNINNKVGQS